MCVCIKAGRMTLGIEIKFVVLLLDEVIQTVYSGATTV
jgi:hypothetical protein